MQRKEITVVGLGYIGLPTAVVLAEAGHKVKGYDVKRGVRESLKAGKIHIVERYLQEAYEKVKKSGNLRITEEISVSDIYIICVPTPFKEKNEEKKADLTYVEAAICEVAAVLKKGDLVILESTVPPHTTAYMTQILAQKSGLAQEEFYTAHCPERVLPGGMLYELRHNDRIIGAAKEEAARRTKALYETFVKEGKCYTCDDITAELCKLVENTFRDINIAYANQLSVICKESGVDVFQLIELANKHPRVNILKPGLGVGGHCLAVDPWFLVEKYRENANLIKAARQMNESKPLWIKEQIMEAIGRDKNRKIGILGMSYKPNIDDMRESPSLVLAQALKRDGYKVEGCEPNSREEKIDGITLRPLDELLLDSDYLVLALAHDEFKDRKVTDCIKKKPYYDCTGFFKEEHHE